MFCKEGHFNFCPCGLLSCHTTAELTIEELTMVHFLLLKCQKCTLLLFGFLHKSGTLTDPCPLSTPFTPVHSLLQLLKTLVKRSRYDAMPNIWRAAIWSSWSLHLETMNMFRAYLLWEAVFKSGQCFSICITVWALFRPFQHFNIFYSKPGIFYLILRTRCPTCSICFTSVTHLT